MKTPKILNVSVAAALVAVALILSVNNVNAIEYGGFGGRPANPIADNPRTESIFVHTLSPGSVKEDGVRVINNSSTPKTLVVYAADYTPSTGGSFACKQFAESKTAVGKWISLAKSQVTLEPGTNEIVPFTITVPNTAGVGEHNGCILIQEIKADVEGQSGAILSVRTGLRVAIMIPGDITRNLELVGFTVAPEKNGYLLHPQVKNTGNVSIDADVRVVTKYFFGLTYSKHGGQYPILRGETSDWNFDLKKPFFGGWYSSAFVVEYDKNIEAGVGVLSGKSLTKLDGPVVWFFSAPTAGGLAVEIAVILALIMVIVLVVRTKKRNDWIKKNWVEQTVSVGDDINSLAGKLNISWKLLVKVNRLKPPYAIKPGENIKVPPTAK